MLSAAMDSWTVSSSAVAQENAREVVAGDSRGGFRHWTTSDGKRSGTRLKLVQQSGAEVRLQREDNGKIVTFSMARLSTQDRAFLKMPVAAPPNTPPSIPSRNRATQTGAATANWPQWRGANRDGKSHASGLMSKWPDAGPDLLWQIRGLGEGYSTPAVVGETIYLLGTEDDAAFVLALSRDDGRQLWKAPLGSKGGGGGFSGPKGTPTIDGELLFAIGCDGTLACLRRDDGNLVWAKNLKQDFGGAPGHWEYAESPLIDGRKLICTPGGGTQTIVALNKTSGVPIWKSPIGNFADGGYVTAGYASTIAADILGTRQYIAFLHGGVVSVDAKTGTPLWRYDSPANSTANCSTSVVSGNNVFAASAYGTGGGRATLTRNGRTWNVKEDYFVKKMENHHGGFILHEGYIYGTNNSVLLCLDWRNGALQWQNRCVGKGSVTLAENHLYVRGEKGEVALVEATPDEYREKGRFKQSDRSDKNAWAHPVVAGKRLYLHDQDRLMCYDLSDG
ncbi:outer membrane biogenesis protein BamB [Planctomycetes bacterium K23_9]|uniref:Outer membrane biogenesis protein BamB n=2 Tax=Stieleria marina TaxID=1930275 RepID=A0A517NPR6_9BACT|nr:outer membrane biogenesis protein BamB [Planctomycetes bacterium K23_9]